MLAWHIDPLPLPYPLCLWCSAGVVYGMPRAGSHYNLGTSRGSDKIGSRAGPDPRAVSCTWLLYNNLLLDEWINSLKPKPRRRNLIQDETLSKTLPKARRTYSRLCLFTTRLNCREPIWSRLYSVHCPDYSTYTLTTRSRPSESLIATNWCLLSLMYMHHGAIWCLDTHQ